MKTITFETLLELHSCHKCGIVYGWPEGFEERRREDHATFYCPNGHPAWYPHDNKEELLKKRLAAKEEELRRIASERDFEQTRANNNLKALRKAQTLAKKAKARAEAGVCPCCNRTFQDVVRHMANKHGDDPKAAGLLEKARREADV